MEEHVVLVDSNDKELGTEEKIAAHKAAKLHRAFSIFVFNRDGKLLLQQRAAGKYHGAGLWSNTVCSHPRPGESIEAAAHRKLKQELGFDCALKERFSFVYKVDMRNGLWEHEFDHVLVGSFDAKPKPNPEEVQQCRWADPADVLREMDEDPDSWTLWARIALQRLLDKGFKPSG